MQLWMYQSMHFLAQRIPLRPWDDGDSATKTSDAPKPLSFGDLQKSMRSELNGEANGTYYRNVLLGSVVAVAVLALVLHWRQRRKSGGPLNSVRRLGWELSRAVRFPMGTRVLLWWVSVSTRVPVAVLLISGEAFESSVAHWAKEPTFGVLREWGLGRLEKLKGVLFEVEAAGGNRK